jgi:uncharacterized membrane protein YfcA
MLTLAFGAISLLYSTVGQAGGTGFLAVMAFTAFPADEMRPTALLLNILAAAYATWHIEHVQHVPWATLRPLLLASLPTAFLGGFVVLDEGLYRVVSGLVLIAAAAIPIFWGEKEQPRQKPVSLSRAATTGAAVGFVSGLTGIGGGVFLAPLVIGFGWASPRQTAALSPPFILANSAVGLAATWYVGQRPADGIWLYAGAVLVGAVAGTVIGLRYLSQTATRYVLAAILASAGIQLLFL